MKLVAFAHFKCIITHEAKYCVRSDWEQTHACSLQSLDTAWPFRWDYCSNIPHFLFHWQQNRSATEVPSLTHTNISSIAFESNFEQLGLVERLWHSSWSSEFVYLVVHRGIEKISVTVQEDSNCGASKMQDLVKNRIWKDILIIQNGRADASLLFVLVELSACYVIGIHVIIQERCVYIAYRVLGTVWLEKHTIEYVR